MAQVVVGLEYVLALQEKTNSTMKPTGRTICGKKVPLFVFPSKGEDLRYYLDTIQGENHIFRRFDFNSINVATENFSIANKVSQTRYISMYKGRLQNGQDIAIAETSSNKFVEYMNEASILVKCEHENLVKLLGYCIEGTQVFLVYEFASNASLYHLLHDTKYFQWATTINETDCIHVDVFRGFIMANTCTCDSGYGAPECLQNGVLSTKADVYSLGVLVLETITGHSASHYISLVEYVERNWLEGTLSDIIDPRIDVDSSSMTRYLEIGLLCVQEDAADRPTMEEVVSMLLDSSSLALRVSKMRAMVTRERSDSTSTRVDDYDTGAVEEFISYLYPR
ncbi:hypothetical protein L1987_14497 [Smallanthus sonchifolius]|uniref:Uncharacterized protein n=1 Tax=Smallanthus sonchifolius TaxID=185202 RepID=A0ACB9J401_9ASTR|nr:hypothetical protein L1987_14497 [Smallanthus sonchifolius]